MVDYQTSIPEGLRNLVPTGFEERMGHFREIGYMQSLDYTPRGILIKLSKNADTVSFFTSLKNEFPPIHFTTITASDLNDKIELQYNLLHDFTLTLDVVVDVSVSAENKRPETISITSVLPAAEIYEREVKDLFGVDFIGLPHPQRLILPDEWPENTYPLKKNYVIKSPAGKAKQNGTI